MRALALAVSQLIRPDDVVVPVESTTFGENCWAPDGAGQSYSNTAVAAARPFVNSSRRHKDRRKPGKKKQRRAVNLPVAAAQYYDPHPDGAVESAYDDPARCEMRRHLFAASQLKSKQPCANERLYAGRQPTGEFAPEVRAEGKRKRQFWTLEEETAEHRRVREEIRREQQQTGDGPATTPANPRARPGTGRGKKLSMEDGIYLTTRVIRGGRSVAQEGADFGVGEDTAGRMFRQSVRGMAEMLRKEHPRPTREEVFSSTPAGFVKALGGLKDTGMIGGR